MACLPIVEYSPWSVSVALPGRGCLGRTGYPSFVETWGSWFLDIMDTWGRLDPIRKQAQMGADGHQFKALTSERFLGVGIFHPEGKQVFGKSLSSTDLKDPLS